MASKKNGFFSDPMLKGANISQAGSPSEVIMRNYPDTAKATYDLVYDDIQGIDKQQNRDVKGGGKAVTKY